MGNLLNKTKEMFQTTTKQQIVYDILKENIINGHLKPGTRLVLSKIAQELNVSEIPVREAIRKLDAQGLVKITPHAGAKVTQVNIEDVEEIAAIRGLLEGYATKLAMERITDEILKELNDYIDKMEECIKIEDDTNFGILNKEFHQIIYRLCPYNRLQKMIFDLWNGFERTRGVFGFSKERLFESLREHREILKAIENRDGDEVEALVRSHKIRSGEVLISYLKNIEEDKDDDE